MPVKAPTGDILGTVDLYYLASQAPEPGDFRLAERITHFAGLVMENVPSAP